MSRCHQANCHYPRISCMLGEMDAFGACSHWESAAAKEQPAAGKEEETCLTVPWNGLALGRADLFLLAARHRPAIVGVLGPHDAGKTTFLVGTYLLVRGGQRLAGHHFAGSLTLSAWESLAAWMRWTRAGLEPTFPPHTSSQDERRPGLLHMALRAPNGALRDVLFTDAPGEWFSTWAQTAAAPGAEGARWIARHANNFLIFADSTRLAGIAKGPARHDLRSLLERLSTNVGVRPVALVWAKSDVTVSSDIKEAIERALAQQLPGATLHRVSIMDGDSLLAAASAAVEAALRPIAAKPLATPICGRDPFLTYRGTP